MRWFVKIGVYIAVVLMLSTVGFAEETVTETETEVEAFDPEALFSGFPTYKYDRFDKTWRCYYGAIHYMTDVSVVLGLEVDGNDECINEVPYLYAFMESLETNAFSDERDFRHVFTKVQLLINDTIYTFDPVYTSDGKAFIFIYENYKELMDCIADGLSLTMKLTWDDGSTEIDYTTEEYMPLKSMAAYLRTIDVWQYCSYAEGNPESYAEYYPMEISQ